MCSSLPALPSRRAAATALRDKTKDKSSKSSDAERELIARVAERPRVASDGHNVDERTSRVGKRCRVLRIVARRCVDRRAGDVWVGLATGYWRGDSNRQIDAPVVSAAVGITPRVQAGGSASFYHFRDADGISENGFGKLSLYGKFLIADPARAPNAIGVAVTPLIEFSPGSEAPVGWALPVNRRSTPRRRAHLRIGGYFSRGSIFATVGADIPVTSRISINGKFGQSYARAGTHQTSLGVGASFGLTATSGLFVGLGQTFMPSEVGPGGVSLAGGMSFLLPQPQKP